MALRAPHGRAKTHGAPGARPEVMPADELPSAPGRDPAPSGPIERAHTGRFQPGNTVSHLGGQARAGQVSYGASLGLSKAALERAGVDTRGHLRKAASYRRVRCAELTVIAGGIRSMGPATMIASAAKLMCAANVLFEAALGETDVELRLKLIQRAESCMNSARQNEIAAYELAVREGPALLRAKPGQVERPEDDAAALEAKKAQERAALGCEGVGAE